MIVCSCNVLSDAKVNEALASPHPPCRVLDVHRRLGCRPECGRCARAIMCLIRDHQAATPCSDQHVENIAAA